MTARENIVTAARGWLGVRWQHQGRTRHGIDCAGLIVCVGLDLGLFREIPPADYPRRPNGTFLPRMRASELTEIRPGEAQPGDVLAFTTQAEACHCGILAELYGQPSVVHAHVGRRKVCEELVAHIPAEIGIATHAFRYPRIEEV